MRTDGRTGMTKLIVAFHNFAKAPRNVTQNRGSINKQVFIDKIK